MGAITSVMSRLSFATLDLITLCLIATLALASMWFGLHCFYLGRRGRTVIERWSEPRPVDRAPIPALRLVVPPQVQKRGEPSVMLTKRGLVSVRGQRIVLTESASVNLGDLDRWLRAADEEDRNDER